MSQTRTHSDTPLLRFLHTCSTILNGCSTILNGCVGLCVYASICACSHISFWNLYLKKEFQNRQLRTWSNTPLLRFLPNWFPNVKGVCWIVCACILCMFSIYHFAIYISKKNSKTDNREPTVTHPPLTFFANWFSN